VAKQKGYQRWSMAERVRLGSLLVDLIVHHAGLVALDSVRTSRNRTRVYVRLLPEVADWIAEADRRDDTLEPLYLPMVDVPGDWGPAQRGGYTTSVVARPHLVKNRSRITRELVAEADMPTVYAAVNALQRTAWEVNPDVLEVAQALWDSGVEAPGLERADPEPEPPRPPEGGKAWLKARFLVRRANTFRTARRLTAARVLWLAKRMQPEGSLYFPQQLDFRGRTYPVPAALQPQGTDLARGLLRFGAGRWLTEQDDKTAFWRQGANAFGFDKEPLEDRPRLISARWRDIEAVYRDPLEARWWQDADEPWQFLAWCLEAGQLLETGRVFTRVPCYVDGTNNGLQILSLLLRDEVGGAATNCIPGPRRDVYQDVADRVNRLLREQDDSWARGWMAWLGPAGLPRAAAKRPVMTLPYGCTLWSVRKYLIEWYEEEMRQGRPDGWAGFGLRQPFDALATLLWRAIQELLGRPLAALEWLKAMARTSVDAGVAPTWRAPSGFPVRQAYTNMSTTTVRTKFGERVRWVRSKKAGDRLNKGRHVRALAANFVHSLDAGILARVVARLPAGTPVSTIHDSFGALAPDMPLLNRVIREEYAAVFQEDWLQKLRDELVTNAGGRVNFPQPPERGTLDPVRVLDSDYLFS